MPTSAELTFAQLRSPAYTFFALGDHQNFRQQLLSVPLNAADLRYALNYQMLFAGRTFLIAEDMLVNERLMALLLNEYRDALADSLFVPLVRDHHRDIFDCAEYLQAPDYYNQTGEGIWRANLKSLRSVSVTHAAYPEEHAYWHYTTVARRLLTDDAFLRSCGIGIAGVDIENGITAVQQAAGRTYWRRSAVFAYADELAGHGHGYEARELKRIASVLYMAHFGGLFGQTGVYPTWYAPYVAQLAALPTSASLLDMGAVSDVPVELELVLPNTRKEDLAQLGLADVYELRSTVAFADYLAALQDPAVGWRRIDRVITALGRYLEAIDEHVSMRQSGLRGDVGRHRSTLALVRSASVSGVVLGLADLAARVVDPGTSVGGLWADGVLAGTGLLFLILESLENERLDALEQERRDFWNAYCGSDGPFSGQIAALRGRMAPA